MERKKPIRRLVVKFGTANLCDTDGRLVEKNFNSFAGQIKMLKDKGIEVVIVSSGGIKAGRERLENAIVEEASFLSKKEFAGIGSLELLKHWADAFCPLVIAQVWVTYANWQSWGERKSIKSSIINYLKAKVTPIINENDVVSSEEIDLMDKKISENDRLARMVTFLIDADAVLFLTEEGGIFNDDPKKNPDAKIYEEVSAFADPKKIGISKGVSRSGTGGMMAKLQEASLCVKKGMRVAIAGNEENVILKFANGEPVGTRVAFENRIRGK